MGSSASSGGTVGVDVAGAGGQAEPAKWWVSLALGGKLYGVPCNAEQMLVYDPNSLSGMKGVDTKHIAVGTGKWRSAVAIGRKIFCVPDRAEKLLVYDTSTSSAVGVDTTRVAKGDFKWQAAAALAGKVYGIPFHAEKILAYNPETRQVVGIASSHVAAGPAKWFAGAALDGRLYGVPCNASSILVYDPVTGKASGVDIGRVATGPLKWLAATTARGKLYGVPCHADCVLVYDPATGDAYGVDTSSIASGPGKWVCCLSAGGKIYGIPDHADNILVLDPFTDQVSGIDVRSVASGPTKWQSAVFIGGKIYATPHHADCILVFDPATEEVSGISTASISSGPAKWSTCALLGRKLLGLPYNATHLLEHEVEAGTACTQMVQDLPAKLDSELLEDFLAAWLSEWIYHANDPALPHPVPPVSIDGEEISFHVHKVSEDALQGSPARMGIVTVSAAKREKVLYLVFKGTSFLSDFIVNGSVSPDTTPFYHAFGDTSTFVHHGAHHAIAQLRVHQWQELLEQLWTEFERGTSRLVVTGHSLGGQYALAFLLQLFLERHAPATRRSSLSTSAAQEGQDVHPLLHRARAVVFGAPMCFGAAPGADVRQDLAEFMHERSVNYINSGDPAPRLWSELDLDAFMRYFVDWIQGQISSFSRRLVDYAAGTGGIAKRAHEMLQRPDIETHLLKPAARYVHLSRIRLLGAEFRPWRPLTQELIRLEDHSLTEGYIPALRSAFDPSASGGLFDEDGHGLVDEERQGLA